MNLTLKINTWAEYMDDAVTNCRQRYVKFSCTEKCGEQYREPRLAAH